MCVCVLPFYNKTNVRSLINSAKKGTKTLRKKRNEFDIKNVRQDVAPTHTHTQTHTANPAVCDARP